MNLRNAGAAPLAELSLAASPKLLPLAQSFAEFSAKAAGLDSQAALSLALATEEIFMRLCSCLPAGSRVNLRAGGRGGRVALDFLFPSDSSLDMEPFNLCSESRASAESLSDDAIGAMGLLLAARSVDSLSLREEPGAALRLRLLKERVYGDSAALPKAEFLEVSGSWTVRPPSTEELPLAAALLLADGSDAPDFLLNPPKAAALLESGEASALIAVQAEGGLCGVVAWSRLETGRSIECFGPYPLPSSGKRSKEIAASLVDAFISAVCKSDAPAILARRISPAFAASHFEPLPGGDGKAFFRLLEEEEGATVWTSPSIAPYVKKSCEALVLPRFFAESSAVGRALAPHTVFFSSVDRKARSAILRPLRLGSDLEPCLRRHLDALRKEGFERICCELDLGVSWQPLFAEGLVASGFKPGVYLPLSGVGDLLLMDFSR